MINKGLQVTRVEAQSAWRCDFPYVLSMFLVITDVKASLLQKTAGRKGPAVLFTRTQPLRLRGLKPVLRLQPQTSAR